jgi:hypothetical protein
MERISCTVDQLAEALAAVVPAAAAIGPNGIAKDLAVFLNADRLPEPVVDHDEDWIYA